MTVLSTHDILPLLIRNNNGFINNGILLLMIKNTDVLSEINDSE